MLVCFDRDGGPGGWRLERLDLAAAFGANAERWLQQRLYVNPELLLAGAIDPLFADLRPLAMELLLPSGGGGAGADLALDILGVSPLGGVALVEVKLGRNAEARRQIVAQVLEYAGALRRLGYAGLEAQLRAMERTALGLGRAASIHEAAGAPAGMDPAAFADSVARNIARGRVLLLLAVDRARPELRGLIEDLRTQPGLPFEIGLVEVACYRACGESERICMAPRLLHAFRAVERAVVRVIDERDGGGVRIEPVVPSPLAATTLTEEEFYAELERREPGLPNRLRACVARLAEINVRAEVRQTLILRAETTAGEAVSLGYVDRAGLAYIYPASARLLRRAGMEEALKRYLDEVARLIGGEAVTGAAAVPANWCVKKGGRLPPARDLLEQCHGWRDAIARLLGHGS